MYDRFRNIRNKLRSLTTLFSRCRQSGSTSLLKEIAEKHDCFILVHNEEQKREIGKNAIVIRDVTDAMFMDPKKPILVDNHFMIKLLQEITGDIYEMQKDLFPKRKYSDPSQQSSLLNIPWSLQPIPEKYRKMAWESMVKNASLNQSGDSP